MLSSPARQGELQMVAQSFVLVGFEYLQGWRLHTSLKRLLQSHTMKKDCSNISGNFPVSQSVSITST